MAEAVEANAVLRRVDQLVEALPQLLQTVRFQMALEDRILDARTEILERVSEAYPPAVEQFFIQDRVFGRNPTVQIREVPRQISTGGVRQTSSIVAIPPYRSGK